MKKILPSVLLITASVIFLNGTKSFAQETNQISTTNAINTAVVPAIPAMRNWVARHESFIALAKTNPIDLLFMGDSITDYWRTRGLNIWNQLYAPRHAANFGISGDRTENVLWRIDHGELDDIKPKVVVLLIGTNNTKQNNKLVNTTSEIIEGVTAIVNDIRTKLPDSKILLLGIFPRGRTLDDPQRAQVALVNTVIAKLDDGKMIKFLDIGSNFLETDGTISRDIMADALHPTTKGYQIWADAMEPTLAEMIR